jgi:integrase
MRLNEIINLTWSDVNFDKNEIKVSIKKDFTTKSKRERMIPINLNLKIILQSRLPQIIIINKNDYAFTKHERVKLNGDYILKNFTDSSF